VPVEIVRDPRIVVYVPQAVALVDILDKKHRAVDNHQHMKHPQCSLGAVIYPVIEYMNHQKCSTSLQFLKTKKKKRKKRNGEENNNITK